MPRIKNPFSEENLKDMIHRDFPEIVFDSTKILNNGWANVALDVNGEYIFRFPKDKEAEEHFDHEIPLLLFLHGKMTLEIPYPEFIGKSRKYIGYKKIKGQDLTQEIYSSLSDKEKTGLAHECARFFFEFHSAVSLEKARELGIEYFDPLSFTDGLYEKMSAHFSDPKFLDFVRETIAEYVELVKKPSGAVTLYQDLHGENVAFDTSKKKLNGVFDFADVEIGEPEREFAYLYLFEGPLFMDSIAEYEKLSGRKISPRKSLLYKRIYEIDDLSEHLDDPESDIYKKAIERIHRWMKEKDIYR